MLDILTITVPLYACVFVGYAAVRWGPFARRDVDTISAFVMNIALPALMFSSLSARPLAEALHPTYLLVYALASLVTLVFGYVYSRRVERTGHAAAAFDAMGMGAANSGFIGFPLFSLLLPALAGPIFGMNVLVESLLTFPLVFFWAGLSESAGSFGAQVRAAVVRMATMPVMIALVAGMVVSLLGWHLPEVLTTSLDLFGRASTALALFGVGGMLVGIRVRGQVRRIVVVTAGKLLVMPGVAFVFVWVLGWTPLPPLGDDLALAAVVGAGLPTFTSSVIFAATFGEKDVPPAVMLLTTLGSFVTVTGLLVLLG